MPEQYGDDLFDDANDGQPLPPDLQKVYRELLEDGAAWRTDVPPMPDLDESVRAMLVTARTSTRHHDTIAPMHLRERSTPAAAIHRSSHRSLHRKDSSLTMKTRLGAIASVAAAVAVVALMIGVFAIFGHGHGNAAEHSGSNTAAQWAQTKWQTIPGLGYSSERSDDTGPAVAPSDPHVVYESNVGREGAYGGNAYMRRTDDAGATWHSLAFPVPVAHIEWVEFIVSPLNSHTVILQVADTTASDCPASFIVTKSESNQPWCFLQYLSTDGGATLSLLQTPLSDLVSGRLTWLEGAAIVAQGSTLYAQVACPDDTCTHIVRSSDGGHSWSLDDAGLHQQAPFACGFIAAPSGETLYAVTADKSCLLSYQGTLKLTLWRSDDAGSTWVPVAALPTSTVYGLLAVETGDPAQPLLYGFMPRTVSVTPDKEGSPHGNLSNNISDIKVSADGGKTWLPAPSHGIATGLLPDSAPLGVLSDGSIIASFIPQGLHNENRDLNGSVLYGWKQGDTAWHQIAPALTKILSALTIVPGSNGHDTLWVFEEGFNGQPWSDPDVYTAARFQLP